MPALRRARRHQRPHNGHLTNPRRVNFQMRKRVNFRMPLTCAVLDGSQVCPDPTLSVMPSHVVSRPFAAVVLPDEFERAIAERNWSAPFERGTIWGLIWHGDEAGSPERVILSGCRRGRWRAPEPHHAAVVRLAENHGPNLANGIHSAVTTPK